MNALWHFAGLWPLVWKMSVTTLAIAGLLAFAFLAPTWLLPNFSRKLALWVAAGLACSFAIYSVGVLDEAHRKNAKQDAGLKVEASTGEQYRKDAERVVRAEPPRRVRNDPRNRDNRGNAGPK